MKYNKNEHAINCNISLKSLGLNSKLVDDNISINKDVFYKLIFNTPTNANLNYGIKFKSIKSLNGKKSNSFLNEIFDLLSITSENILLFSCFKSKKNRNKITKENIKIDSSNLFVLLKIDNGVKESLYISIRNALAHGNIIKKNKFYYLFSLSNSNNKISDNEKKIKFLMKLNNLEQLAIFTNTLEKYINESI